jgi:alginate O-acetyltransferase complex protein AlgI
MLFNSLLFILFFFPITYGALALASRLGRNTPVIWLGLASLGFYAWTEARYLPLLLTSITLNYLIGNQIIEEKNQQKKTMWLTIGISGNFLGLAYYKYSGLFVESLNKLASIDLNFIAPALPIGISFFTFTQIAFLVDAKVGKVQHNNPARYFLFVTYFPHLIAGPILHHAQMMPQFARNDFGKLVSKNFLIGAFIFLIGLFKKVILADGISQFVNPVFDTASSSNSTLLLTDAWIGALSYTFQLYFDFSGYSDMAIGLSRMMGITLPENFDSPYKSKSISEFWRKWHISLSSFLRDYLYIPLGGNRDGQIRRYSNLMITMLLGGFWHGASWTFLVWGGLHGIYLVCNHAWTVATKHWPAKWHTLLKPVYYLTTFMAVVVGWIFFRATSFTSAFKIIDAMITPNVDGMRSINFEQNSALLWLTFASLVVFFLPNTSQFLSSPKIKFLLTSSNIRWAFLGGIITTIFILTLIAESAVGRSPFIYFNF